MEEKRFAVLIDAENISGKYIKTIFDELSNDGTVTYKRIYGDWTKPSVTAWKNVLLNYSITPVQQYSYTTGKNSSDSAMIIDAMDILYSGNVDGFCLVSSDSDFTRLASRLRESGMYVVGMGERKTPGAFIAACNRFIYLEIVEQSSEKLAPALPAQLNRKQIQMAIMSIIDTASDDNGWISLGELGSILVKRFPDFDVRNFGHKKLSDFIMTFEDFMNKKANGQLYIRRNTVSEFTEIDVKSALIDLYDELSSDDEWVDFNDLNNNFAKKFPQINIKDYGSGKMKSFMTSIGCFEITSVDSAEHTGLKILKVRKIKE